MKRLSLAVVVAGLVSVACGAKSDDETAVPADPSTFAPAPEGVEGTVVVPVSGAEHVNGKVNYPTSPPAGGKHNAVWQNCGFYTVPVTNELAVHSLEHGAVWITYSAAVDQTVKADLAAKARTSRFVLVSPYPDNPAPIVVTAWARQLRLASYDSALVAKFIDVFAIDGPTVPEKGAPCRGGVGIAPDRPSAT
ncbi:MAG TPA: DUF3105 domain-containing protein [Acidimicrobiales bacterium]|nr:DUF3105 domain-containing protein [Acidimicrobiales bacterium]